MYKKILVGVDGSQASMKALREAVTLAKLLEATVDLLYVIPSRMYSQYSNQDVVTQRPDGTKEHISLLQKEENELFDAARALTADIGQEVIIHTRVGDAVEELVEFSESNAHDLVIVGSSGKGMADRLILGSVSTGVVHQSRVSVLVIKPD
jgi:nucleotide-binding universal stress UspA family protein